LRRAKPAKPYNKANDQKTCLPQTMNT
jgi:hypothetical protein